MFIFFARLSRSGRPWLCSLHLLLHRWRPVPPSLPPPMHLPPDHLHSLKPSLIDDIFKLGPRMEHWTGILTVVAGISATEPQGDDLNHLAMRRGCQLPGHPCLPSHPAPHAHNGALHPRHWIPQACRMSGRRCTHHYARQLTLAGLLSLLQRLPTLDHGWRSHDTNEGSIHPLVSWGWGVLKSKGIFSLGAIPSLVVPKQKQVQKWDRSISITFGTLNQTHP